MSKGEKQLLEDDDYFESEMSSHDISQEEYQLMRDWKTRYKEIKNPRTFKKYLFDKFAIKLDNS